jgi:hypothetical protein
MFHLVKIESDRPLAFTESRGSLVAWLVRQTAVLFVQEAEQFIADLRVQ